MIKNRNILVAIVGPTAVGKSNLAIRLAKSLNGEILNGDSRLVYRQMDIGTDKPSLANRSEVKHHLIDILNPDDTYNLSLYLDQARSIVDDTNNVDKVPFLVGGTGQYIWGLIDGFRSPNVAPNNVLRYQLQQKAQNQGSIALWNQLELVDPLSASKIDYRNTRRIIRALEVYLETGIPISQAQNKNTNLYESLIIGLTMDREHLYNKIDSRIDQMIANGWIEEVKHLLGQGYSPDMASMYSIGYRDITKHIEGQMDLDDTISKIKTDTHRLARSQYAWFKPTDPRIQWFDASGESSYELILQMAISHISKSTHGDVIIS